MMFSGSVQSACGYAQAAMGPFYCPADHKVYLDLSFFDELHQRFGAPGDFAQAYVIAHEVGHHVQNLMGISAQVQAAGRGASKAQINALSVRQELQADCFAGVWAHLADSSRQILDPGDLEEALGAATAIGDDRLQKQAEDPGCTYLHAATPGTFEGFAVEGPHASLHVPSVTRTSKFFSDARGWLAHVHHGTVFLRIFPDLTLAQIAPRQGEVELFFDPVRDYIEIENQGAYETLASGETLTYAVEWRFGAVDPNLPTDRITPELLRSIHALLA